MEELGALLAWSEAYARSPHASLSAPFSVSAPVPAAPQLLAYTRRKDAPAAPVYGKIAVRWQVDRWQYAFSDLELPESESEGQPRSAYSGPILIQGEPATERYVAAARAAIARARPKKEAIERKYQEDLAQATRAGTLYKGQLSRRGKTMPAEVRFVAAPGGDPGLARFELLLPATGYVYTCSARRAGSVPNLPVVPPGGEGESAERSEAAPRGDLSVNYESVKEPRFNLASELANDLLYSRAEIKDATLDFHGQELHGTLVNMDPHPGFVLSAQRSP